MSALVDRPACLDLDVVYVGAAATPPAPARGWRRAWWAQPGWSSTASFRRQAVAECIDLAATLRAYREPLPGEAWTAPEESERRLLAQVNAVLLLGVPAMEQVLELASDPDLPDPGRVFAVMLVLGCARGRRWRIERQRLFEAVLERHPGESAAAVEALCMAAESGDAEWLMDLCGHASSRVRAAAVRVLGYRGQLTGEAWHAALQDPSTRSAALASPMRCPVPADAWDTLASSWDDPRPAVQLAALRTGLRLRWSAAHRALRARLGPRAPQDWWSELARAGAPGDAGLIRDALRSDTWPEVVDAAAVAGTAELAEELVQLWCGLRDETLASAVERAVDTVVGPGMPWRQGVDAVCSAWRRREGDLVGHPRWRHGRPWGPAVLVDDLARPAGTRAWRQGVYRELLPAWPEVLPRFDAHDFVAAQRDALASLAALVDPGTTAWVPPGWH